MVRRRVRTYFTLDPVCVQRLREFSEAEGRPMSRVVEDLIMGVEVVGEVVEEEREEEELTQDQIEWREFKAKLRADIERLESEEIRLDRVMKKYGVKR